MTETNTAPTPKRRNWLKLFGIALGALVVLLLVMYFVVTSSGFIKGVVLPKVSKSMGANITVSDISLSPFKQVILKDLKVQAPGKDPLFTSPEIQVQYRLMDILKGNYVVDLISVKSPVLALVEAPDKTSNLDPIMEALGEDSSDEPMNLDLKKLVISDGTIRYEKKPSAEGSYSSEISNFNLNIDGLKTGSVGKMTVNGNLRMESSAPAPGTNGSMAGVIKGDMDIGLTPMLMPSVLKGSTRMEITEAKGGYALASGVAIVFDADLTSTQVNQLALRLLQGQQSLGQFTASGPFSIEKSEGTLDVIVSGIDKKALNLATGGTGMDFGGTSLNSSNRIQMAKGGQSLTASGAFFLNEFQVTRTNQTTPSINLQANYDLSVDQASSNLVLRALTMNGSQSGKEFLKGGLSAPMAINWGNQNTSAGDAALTINVTSFDLGAWKAFTGDALSSGLVNSRIELLTKEAGKRLVFSHRSGIENLSMAAGSNNISGVTIILSGDGEAVNMEQITTKYDLEVSHRRTPAVQVSGKAAVNTTKKEIQADAKGGAILPVLVEMLSLPDARIARGNAELGLVFQQKGELQTVQGDFNLKGLTGSFGSNVFQDFNALAKLDMSMNPQTAELKKTVVNLSQAGKNGGSVEMAGSYGLSNQVAQFKFSLKDLNQNVLSTFLQPSLGDKELASIAVNGQATVNYDPKKPSNIAADFKVSNLVVKDPTGKVPGKPLEASLAFETTIDKSVAEIRKGVFSLTPTERAKNQVQLAGRIDMSNTNFTSGNLKLTSESMDLTTYYDLFDGGSTKVEETASSAPAPKTGGAAQPAGKPAPEQEAEPMILPVTNFVAEVSIGQFFLRELTLTNLTTTLSIDGGKIRMPFQMAMNGAPVKSSVVLDLGVPGYKYDVGFQMNQVPFAPLVNTFTPDRKGQVGGTITANLDVKGAGTTGASLQKNLAGNFMIGTTNLNLSISELRSPLLKTIINVISAVPTIIKNPSAGLSSFTGSLFGRSSSGTNQPSGGWSDELLKSPVDIIEATGTMGGGLVKLDRAFVQSPAFQAEARGTVELAKVLTNSTLNIPLNVSIKRSLAESVNLVPPGTPTNAVYVKLPDYVAVKGTMGNPKPDYNTKALVGTALQQYGGSLGLDKKTGNVLQNIGGILTGRKATNAPAATGTNAPAGQTTNAPAGGLFQNLGGLLGGRSVSTNPAPATVTNQPQTQTNPVGSLIEGFLNRPKKK